MRKRLHELSHKVASGMQRDRFRLRRQIRKLKTASQNSATGTKPLSQEIEKLAADVDKSCELFSKRNSTHPQPNYDEDLPIYLRRAEIIQAIKDHQVVVISGETGSGKSTQLPLIALEAGFGVSGFIGHTQPRRIAARSVASRIAQQLNSSLGSHVGFKIRFDDKTSDQTFIKLMTDGILLAETQTDRFFDQYEMLIIDEAHERSLNIDFLLGYIKQIMAKRPDLKIIITSATIDTERFAAHFGGPEHQVPIINVEGRTYPVEIIYRDPVELTGKTNPDVHEAIVDTVKDRTRESDGDILVFLPTENDIRVVSKKLKGANLPGRRTEVLPLYARLSTQQQNLIFQPQKDRRVVLATNVAESSITVPRISTVIDTGTARISRYAPRSKVQRLPIEAVSQASANQRAGRCGRIGPGTCVRLYSEEDYTNRTPYTTPEIRRTNLASVILKTLSLRLGNVAEFPFIDPPHTEAIRDGYKTLREIGAIDDRKKLTKLGRWLARLPVDPRIGRMIHAADDENCLSEILVIAAALEIQDPRVRPAEKQKAADEQHEKFLHEKSDFMSYLKLWDFLQDLKDKLSRSKFKHACAQNFLSFTLVRQWQDVHRQLRSMVLQNGLKTRDRKDDYNAIHRSLLAGYLSGIAMLGDRHEFTGAGGIKFHLWPGSGVFESKPKWIVASEIVETSRRYGRTVGKIAPEWIEPLADHLVSRKFVDPHWSKKRQTTMAYENVSLFGLPIVNRRLKGYNKVDPGVSRDLFIEDGIVADQLASLPNFVVHNQLLLEELQSQAAKTRRRDLVIDEYAVIRFYQEHIPVDCCDSAALKRALKSDPTLEKRLEMQPDDLLPDTSLGSFAEAFPDRVAVGAMQIPVEYRFQPGDEDDGATVTIPLEGIGQIDDIQAGWLIPGYNEQRVTALIKSLPKSLRRMFVPAADTAKKVCEQLSEAKGAFNEAVANQLSRIAGQPVSASDFNAEKVDSHLRVNIKVVDEGGEVVARGRSVRELRSQLGAEATSAIIELDDDSWKQDGLKDWTWDELPEEIVIRRGSTQLAAFPSIVDQNDSVGLRLVDSRAAADEQTRQGLVRLLQIINRKNVRSQTNWLPDLDQHTVKLSRYVNSKQLKSELADLIVRIAMVEKKPIPRRRADFDAIQENRIESVSIATQEVASWLPKFAKSAHEMALAIEGMSNKFSSAKGDIRLQLKTLTEEHFISRTPWLWLKHFPRFFDAIKYRIDKLPTTPPVKDKEQTAEVIKFWELFQQQAASHQQQSIVDPELTKFRWMVEEFRVSLFAQPLGTSLTVSSKRLEKQFAKVRRTD